MKKVFYFFLSIFLVSSCTNYGQLKIVGSVPDELEEVSGVEKIKGSDILWMHNDGGNEADIYGVNVFGEIQQTIALTTKNKDWEDITSDEEGNLYIADFGNNGNKRKNLVIYKITAEELASQNIITPEKIKFKYPNQTKFPPKKKKRFFDAESLLYFKGGLYVFTKSRVKGAYGKTSLYKVPTTKGKYTAEYIDTFENCNSSIHCWVTAACVSPDKKKVALLTHDQVLIFTDFTNDNFFSGVVTEHDLGHTSQKEGITFKDNNTLYITDEQSHGAGGKLYEFSLVEK